MPGKGDSTSKEARPWWTQKLTPQWLALLAIVTGVFTAHLCAYPFAAVPNVVAQFYTQAPLAVIRWTAFIGPVISMPAIMASVQCIPRHGIHVCVYTCAGLLLLGNGLRSASLIQYTGDEDRQGLISFVLVFVGTAVAAFAIAPCQVAGSLVVGAAFPAEGRVVLHAVVRSFSLTCVSSSAAEYADTV